MLSVQTATFDAGALHADLRARAGEGAGALVTFTGYVRDFASHDATVALHLEHYPGMCERVLQALANEAAERWHLAAWSLVHRVGELSRAEPIVFVGAASGHRADAFAACEFMIDTLKTRAPFWKREVLASGKSFWVQQKPADAERASTWLAQASRHT